MVRYVVEWTTRQGWRQRLTYRHLSTANYIAAGLMDREVTIERIITNV